MKYRLLPFLLQLPVFFFIASFINIAQQKPEGDGNYKKVEWLKNNVIPIKSVDPSETNYSDLEPIKGKIGNARVFMLGEQSHGDGTTFLMKSRLIQFLVKEMGFSVILFESGFYDCEKINELLKNGDSAKSAISKGIFRIWNQSEQFQPLVNFIGENRNSLEIGGFDCQYTGTITKEFFINDFEKFLQDRKINLHEIPNWPETKIILKNISEDRFLEPKPLPPSVDKQSEFQKTIQGIITKLQKLPTERKVSFWIQLLNSTLYWAKSIWLEYGQNFDSLPPEISNRRDIQMGENLNWHALTNYPEKKIIVWAASYHIARNLQMVEMVDIKNRYAGTICMGDIAYNKLADSMYSVCFTAYEGNMGMANNDVKMKIEKPMPGSLEDLLFKTNFENSYLDLKNLLPDGKWLENKVDCRPLGYARMFFNLPKTFDAIIFTRTMIQSTKTNR